MAQSLDDLRRCVAHSSTVGERPLILLLVAQVLSETKVDQFDVTLAVYHHVFWFQVPVHNLGRVDCLQRH